MNIYSIKSKCWGYKNRHVQRNPVLEGLIQYFQKLPSALEISCFPQVDVPRGTHPTKDICNKDPFLSLTWSKVRQVDLLFCLSSSLVSFT